MKAYFNKEWVEILKALGHGTRLQIVIELLEYGTKCVTDIQEILPVSQANISQHLTVLRSAGIVDFTQSGAQRCYFVRCPELVGGILKLLKNDPKDNEKKKSTCCIRS